MTRDHIALSEHSDQLAVLHNEHTAELFLPHELDSVPHGRVVPSRHGGGAVGSSSRIGPRADREGGQRRPCLCARSRTQFFLPRLLFPHCLHTLLRPGHCRGYCLP